MATQTKKPRIRAIFRNPLVEKLRAKQLNFKSQSKKLNRRNLLNCK
jgi:hypothetical protein